MSSAAKKLMTVDEFLDGSQGHDGRWEIQDVVPYQMAAERTRHAATKFKVQRALDDAIRKAGVGCTMLADGPLVRVSDATAYEPDALVYCGPTLPGDAIEVPNPVVVVEVSSPSTTRIDALHKLAGYFQVSSLQHYLMIEPDGGPTIQQLRQDDGTILTRIIMGGEIRLDPPGISITATELLD